MLNGSEEYYMVTNNIKNLEIYLDGVQIRDAKKIERNGQAYIFKAEKLVSTAESQPIAKQIPTSAINQLIQPAAATPETIMKQTPTTTQATPSADTTQNNPQGSGR
jgi:hypothetical protein